MSGGFAAKLPRDGYRVSVFGAPGYGKTTIVARSVVRDVMRDLRHTLVYDPTGDLWRYLTQGSASSDVIAPELVRHVESAEHAVAIGHGRAGIFGGVRTHRCYVLDATQGMRRHAEQFLKALNSEKTRGWVFLADECELVFPNKGPDQDDALEGLKLVRNRQQTLYLVGQRPQLVSNLARATATYVCLFRSDSRRFVEVGCTEWGEPEDFEQCYELEKFEYLFRDADDAPPYELRHALHEGIPW